VSPGTQHYTDSGVVYDGRTYTYVVTATNGANKESPRSNTTSFSSIGIPEAPAQPRATTPSANNGATVTVSLGSSRSSGFTRLEWSSNGSSGFVDCPCANGSSRQFTISGTGNTSQSISVRAFNGTEWSAFSQGSDQFTPYGDTKEPSNLQGSRSGTDITWNWNLPTNGRPVDQTHIQAERVGGPSLEDGTFGNRTQYQLTNRNPGTFRLRLQAHSVAGWSGWTNWYEVEIPEPKATLAVLNPTTHRTAGSCNTYSACYEIEFTVSNFKPGTYDLNCANSAYGSFYTNADSVVVSGPDSYTASAWCVADVRNSDWVRITLSGGPSGSVSDTNYNW
jgi:hypothetical protein